MTLVKTIWRHFRTKKDIRVVTEQRISVSVEPVTVGKPRTILKDDLRQFYKQV